MLLKKTVHVYVNTMYIVQAPVMRQIGSLNRVSQTTPLTKNETWFQRAWQGVLTTSEDIQDTPLYL